MTIWRAKNAEHIAAFSARYELISAERRAAYRRANLFRYWMHGVKRRARRLQAIPPWHGEFDAFVEAEAYALAKLRNELTNCRWEVDHMIPLQCLTASGLHCGANLQVIPARLNSIKKNKLMLTERGEWVFHI